MDFSNHNLIRLIARDCVRNTFLEDLHAGKSPSSKTGDYSDVKVVTPYGEIPWNELSKISDPDMRKLMLDVEKKLLFMLSKAIPDLMDKIPEFYKVLEDSFKDGISWDWKKQM
jgi:hypothetical protein